MKILDVIYYHTYLFYGNFLKEKDPHFTTTWGIGVALGFYIVFPINSFLFRNYCINVSYKISFVAILLIYFLVSIYFKRNFRRNQIIKNKPIAFNNTFNSKLATLLFFLFAFALGFMPLFEPKC